MNGVKKPIKNCHNQLHAVEIDMALDLTFEGNDSATTI